MKIGIFAFFGLIIAFGILAIYSASFWPDDHDGVNYLLGVSLYDLTFHRPHFPGYPVYIAAGRLLSNLLDSPERAFIILSVFSGSLCLVFLARLLHQFYTLRTTLFCTIALAVHPLFFEFSHKIFTEVPALALLFMAIVVLGDPAKAVGYSYRAFLAGGIMGIMLGIRLSWWPYPLFYCIKGILSGRGYYILGGLFIGILSWLCPQAAVVGFERLISLGISFTYGHFTQWGGTMLSQGGYERYMLFIARLGEVFGFIGSGVFLTSIPWIAFSLFCIVVTLKSYFRDYKNYNKAQINIFITATLIYIVWTAVGQNPEKIRHLLPLVPCLILIIAPFIERYKRVGIVVILIFSLTIPFNYIARSTYDPPAVQFKYWTDSLLTSNVEFYCGGSERLFDRYPSIQRIINVKDINELDFTVKSGWTEPDIRFICDDIPGFQLSLPGIVEIGAFPDNGKAVIVFPARIGDPIDRTLRIYKYIG